LYPQWGKSGVTAFAKLGEVSTGLASKWVNQIKPIPIDRAILIEINSEHRIRAEDLLSENDALSLVQIRLAEDPKQSALEEWAANSTNKQNRNRWSTLLRRNLLHASDHVKRRSRNKTITKSLLMGKVMVRKHKNLNENALV